MGYNKQHLKLQCPDGTSTMIQSNSYIYIIYYGKLTQCKTKPQLQSLGSNTLINDFELGSKCGACLMCMACCATSECTFGCIPGLKYALLMYAYISSWV